MSSAQTEVQEGQEEQCPPDVFLCPFSPFALLRVFYHKGSRHANGSCHAQKTDMMACLHLLRLSDAAPRPADALH